MKDISYFHNSSPFSLFKIFLSSLCMCIMKMQIFLSRGKSTTDMSLALIQLKYLACLSCQLGVDCRKPLRDILMYGTFADSILLGSLTHGAVILDNV